MISSKSTINSQGEVFEGGSDFHNRVVAPMDLLEAQLGFECNKE